MKKIFTIIVFALLTIYNAQYSAQTISYEVDVSNPEDDLFHVTVLAEGLSPENNIY